MLGRGLADREEARSTMRDALLTESRKPLMADKRARVDDLRGSDFRRSATPVPAGNGLATVRERVPLDRSLTVGRQAMPGQVMLDHPNVSRRHAAFEIVDGTIVLRDLGGTNGTYVNGERLRGARPW